ARISAAKNSGGCAPASSNTGRDYRAGAARHAAPPPPLAPPAPTPLPALADGARTALRALLHDLPGEAGDSAVVEVLRDPPRFERLQALDRLSLPPDVALVPHPRRQDAFLLAREVGKDLRRERLDGRAIDQVVSLQ